jgi:hypothetical protein
MKFGRNRPIAVGPQLRLAKYLRASLPAPPASVDYTPAALPSLRDVYMNDQLGCCVISEGYHAEGTATGNAGDLLHVPSGVIVADYGAIGGYNPADPNTDQGCDEVTALNYWLAHGYSNGTKLLGYLAVDPTNKAEVQAAIWLFENSAICVELPDAWISPFPSGDGFVWDVGAPNPNQGHCFGAVGYASDGVKIDTWGMFGTMTYAALAQLCVAAAGGSLYVRLTPDQLAKGATKAPNGVDWSALIADFDSLGGHVPVPAPPPPPPAPTPGAPVTLLQAAHMATAGLSAGPFYLTRNMAIASVLKSINAMWPKT